MAEAELVLGPSSDAAGGSGRSQRFKIKRVSASQQIHDALRERIVSLEFVPGQSLSRNEIADDYGVSQTPVRDAMLKLEEDGLLLVQPQSKTEVTRIDVAHARETQFLRLSVELEVTRRLATDPQAERLEPVRKILAAQDFALQRADLDDFARLDREFHGALYDAVGVPALWALVRARSGHIDRLRNLNLPDPGKPANILDYHARILDSIAAGDVLATEQAVRGHLSGTLATVEQIMARYPAYF